MLSVGKRENGNQLRAKGESSLREKRGGIIYDVSNGEDTSGSQDNHET